MYTKHNVFFVVNLIWNVDCVESDTTGYNSISFNHHTSMDKQVSEAHETCKLKIIYVIMMGCSLGQIIILTHQ